MSLQLLKPTSKTKLFEDRDHIDNVSEIFEKFYHEQKYLDINLIAAIDNVKVKAHRIVVSAASDYFLAMFSSALKEADAHEIELQNIDGVTLLSIIEFMYSGNMLLNSETVQNILIAADFLQMNELKSACCQFMFENLDVSDCLEIAVFAENFNYTALSQEAYSLALNNLEELCESREFLEINHEQLIKLISCKDEFDCLVKEETIFLSIVTWLEHNRAKREPFLFDILKMVEFQLLTPTFIIENRHSVCTSIESYEIILSWVEWHLLPHTRQSFKKENVVLIIPGGSSTDNLNARIYKPQLNWWSEFEIPSSPILKDNFGVAVINEQLIIVGGTIVTDYSLLSSSSIECLHLRTKKWSKLPPMQQDRHQCAVTELNGQMYAIGGRSENFLLESVEKYDFSTGKWCFVAPLLKTMRIGEVAVLNGLIYAIDVCDGSMQCYNPSTNEWSLKSFKQEASKYFSIASESGYLYTVGGRINKVATNTVERYNPIDDTWSFMAPMKFSRSSVKCAFLNNRMIACAGRDDEGLTNQVEEYNPRTNEWKPFTQLLTAIDGRSKILSY